MERGEQSILQRSFVGESMIGRKKKGLRRSKSVASVKKRLWAIFSEYIRRKDADVDGNVRCFTCGKVSHWKELDAGHYFAKTNGVAMYFDERNVHPQCTGCNRFRHGNLPMYAINLRKKYGDGILEQLDEARRKILKISSAEYYDLIDNYEEKLAGLSERKAFVDYEEAV